MPIRLDPLGHNVDRRDFDWAEKAKDVDHERQTLIPGAELIEVLDERRSVVWRARDSATGEERAIKLAAPPYEPVLPRRLGRRNRQLTRVLGATTGWVPVLATGYARNGSNYVAMPYYDIGSAADQLNQGGMPWFPAANLATKVATTIGSAHELGWSFGYLRPSNILFHGPKTPLVSIYGSATRHFDDGTAQFTAPEVDEVRDVIPASDVFSISLIFASLIAGREIDHSESAQDVLDEIEPMAPGRVLEIIDYGLSPQLENRFADAAKMARALTAALADIDTIGQIEDGDVDDSISETNVLEELLSHEPAPQVASPRPRFSGTDEPDVATNHPDLPAALQDITISRLPRPTRAAGVNNSEWYSGHSGEDGPETDQPWEPDDASDQVTVDAALDAPTSLPFLPTEHDAGPLSDLLDPISDTPSRPVDPFDPDPTMDARQALQARHEINELIAEFGYEGAVSRSLTNSAPGSDDDSAEKEVVSSDSEDQVDSIAGDESADTEADSVLEEATIEDEAPDNDSSIDNEAPDDDFDPPPTVTNPEQSAVPIDLREDIESDAHKPARPHRMARLVDSVYGLAGQRRRYAQSLALLGTCFIVGVGAVAAMTSIGPTDSVVSEGTPSGGTLIADQADADSQTDFRSPLNDLSHLDDADEAVVDTDITSPPRRLPRADTNTTTSIVDNASNTESTTESSDTTDTANPSTTGDVSTSTTLIDESTTSSPPGRPTTEPTTTTTEQVTTSSEQTTTTTVRTTTTDEATTTTKRRGRPRP